MTKLSKKQLIAISVISAIVYIWILGIFGMYGVAITPYIRSISLLILKYGGAFIGLLICIILPFKIQAASIRNLQRLEEFKSKILLEQQIAKEKQQAAIIKKLEETQYYE